MFGDPELSVACVGGGGDAERGPPATTLHSNELLDPATDGAVLPILHLKDELWEGRDWKWSSP